MKLTARLMFPRGPAVTCRLPEALHLQQEETPVAKLPYAKLDGVRRCRGVILQLWRPLVGSGLGFGSTAVPLLLFCGCPHALCGFSDTAAGFGLLN